MRIGDLKQHTSPGVANPVDLGSAVSGLRSTRSDLPNQNRAEQARYSIRTFCTTYLAHHFTSGFSELHYDLFAAIDRDGSSKRIARIAPRMFGKTTIISLALPLQALAYKTHWFVLLLGESATTAEANLSTLTQELETNVELLADFPHLVPAMDLKGQTVKWTDRQIVVKSRATVMARGVGARMRGLKYRERRPDLAVLDDPESPETADTFLKRRRHKRWYGGTFRGLGAKDWDIYAIGNLPHHDCLIADLVKDTETWDGKLYRAVNIPRRENERYPIGNLATDGTPLWPEVWDHPQLEKYKREPNVGSLGFAREMMNDPREEADKIFNPHNFATFVLTDEHLASLQHMATAHDPSGGERPTELKKGRKDYSCTVTAGRTKDGYIDIVAVRMNRLLPDKQLDQILDVYEKWGTRIGIEENMFKNLLETDLTRRSRERGLYPNVKMMTHTSNKISRIMGIQPLIESGVVRFASYLFDKQVDYFAQFDEFPGEFDDGPDATEMVVRMLERGRVVGIPMGIGKTSYWKGK